MNAGTQPQPNMALVAYINEQRRRLEADEINLEDYAMLLRQANITPDDVDYFNEISVPKWVKWRKEEAEEKKKEKEEKKRGKSN